MRQIARSQRLRATTPASDNGAMLEATCMTVPHHTPLNGLTPSAHTQQSASGHLRATCHAAIPILHGRTCTHPSPLSRVPQMVHLLLLLTPTPRQTCYEQHTNRKCLHLPDPAHIHESCHCATNNTPATPAHPCLPPPTHADRCPSPQTPAWSHPQILAHVPLSRHMALALLVLTPTHADPNHDS